MHILKGRLEGDDAHVLGAAIDRMEAWDHGQESRAWLTSLRPGIGLRAYPEGRRWSASTQASWGREP